MKIILYFLCFSFFLVCLPARAENDLKKIGYDVKIFNVDRYEMPAPNLPDISKYTPETIKNLIPKLESGDVKIESMSSVLGTSKFMEGSESVTYRKKQKEEPQVIVLYGGTHTPQTLSQTPALKRFIKCHEENTQEICTLIRPLYIGRNASFVIRENTLLRLGTLGGAFIAGAGRLFLFESVIEGWNEKEEKPDTYVDDKSFRPFLTFWNGSEVYIAKSTLRHLGYMSPKAYGLTFSNDKFISKHPARNQWIIESNFEGLMYGFYTFEASNIVLLRNKYSGNIYYGIDPHDRSKNLIIGYNDVSDTIKRHGIILSREVDNSWVFNNKSYRNGGSGIMIDRSSRGNVLAYNESFENQREGIYIAESHGTLLYQNNLHHNRKNGLRIRNSTDIVSYEDTLSHNGDHGVNGYSISLKHLKRDFKRDPFQQKNAFTVIGSQIKQNGKSVIKAQRFDHLSLHRLEYELAPSNSWKELSGDLGFFTDAVNSSLSNPGQAIEFTNFNFIPDSGKKTPYFKTLCEILTCRGKHIRLQPPQTPLLLETPPNEHVKSSE
ncbi:MAG: right-handed parallel beta-helix repeat-containing protein [Alphaproteobacteria bacterium]|nr:right-handed parallel beta-helix repeat-containing protein [Alphaproteobacteria bacterium]